MKNNFLKNLNQIIIYNNYNNKDKVIVQIWVQNFQYKDKHNAHNICHNLKDLKIHNKIWIII